MLENTTWMGAYMDKPEKVDRVRGTKLSTSGKGDLYLMDEIWKDVVGFESSYEVSSLGRVRSKTRLIIDRKSKRVFKGKILSPGVQSNNYLGVHLYANSKSTSRLIHHLVAEAFIGKRPDRMDVDHINGDRTNNSIVNLRYLALEKNRSCKYFSANPKRPIRKGKETRLTPELVIALRLAKQRGENITQYAKELDVAPSTVFHAADGRSWQSVKGGCADD